MPIESALITILRAAPAVTALLGAAPGTRIYPDVIPIGVTYPAAAYQTIDTVRQSRKLATPVPLVGTLTQLVAKTIQITIHAKTATARASIGEAMREALTGFQGTVAGVWIDRILPAIGERDTYYSETTTYEKQLDFSIWYGET